MNIISAVILILSINFIRKNFDTREILPFWDKLIDKARFLIVALVGLSFFIPNKYEESFSLLWFLFFGMLIYVLWQIKENKIAHNFILAALPYVLVGVLVQILKTFALDFYKDQSVIIGLCETGSIIWFAAYGISSNNQLKALRAEVEKGKAREKDNQKLEFLVNERTAELSKQKDELEVTLEKLTATQSQLIQSEKLASLGELTAGIAHEIQNPLNFVNNFSEINKELLDELKEERMKKITDRNAELEEEILSNIAENIDKIYHHGGRASSIVKNMLEHSRVSSGTKEIIDVNKLCDEYLRLSYHGIRAKDKSFNADFKTNLQEDLPQIEAVPQDFGRVLLNVINNAFYAVQEKAKSGTEDYKPMVSVKSKYDETSKYIEISILDNGIGISAQNEEKIFQPFFTTKPTGQGTGLGLSLSHEIIKAHGGEIKLISNHEVGTEFIISMPINE